MIPYEQRHVTTVNESRRIRDLFRKRFWVNCWHCKLREGPFHTLDLANDASSDLYAGATGTACPGRS